MKPGKCSLISCEQQLGNRHIVYLITNKAELGRVSDIDKATRFDLRLPLETIKSSLLKG